MIALTQQQIDAAQAFANAVIAALQTERGVHAETAIAAAARMAGTFLFRSSGPTHVPAGPDLGHVLTAALAEIGIAPGARQPVAGPLDAHRPALDCGATQARLEPAFAAIRAAHGLSLAEAADAAAVATAFLIHQCALVLDPAAAFGVAVYAFNEGAKTAPGPVAQ